VDPDTLNEPVIASSCLAWNRRALSAWSEEMPLLIETPFDQDDFPRQKPLPDVRGKGAYLSKSKPVSRIAALLNRSSRQDNQLADRP
jgi:hypothetical protein